MSRLTIKDKDARLKQAQRADDFAWAQREFVKQVEYQHNTGQPVRIIVLKGRQVGISTVTEALLFLWGFFFPGTNSLVMSKDRETSENLFEMTKLMWDMWPFKCLFTTTSSSVRRLSWAETLSNFEVRVGQGQRSRPWRHHPGRPHVRGGLLGRREPGQQPLTTPFPTGTARSSSSNPQPTASVGGSTTSG